MSEPARPLLAGVPAAAMLLAQVSLRQPPESVTGVAQLRQAIANVLASVATPPVHPVTLVVAGDDVTLSVAPEADLRPLGLPVYATIRPAPIGNLGEASDHVVANRRALTGDAAVLALQVRSQGGAALPMRVLTVPPHLDAAQIARLAAAAIDDGAVVAATDLAATLTDRSPGYLVEGASEFDDRVVAAIGQGPDQLAHVLADLGPGEADRVMATGWMPLRLLAACATHRQASLGVAAYAAPRGVGHVVISSSA